MSTSHKDHEKHWLFSYGTLQDPEIQQSLFGFRCLFKKAHLPGWSLHTSNEAGYHFIKPNPSGTVTGRIIELTTTAIRVADQWEEVPIYKREKVVVTLEDGTSQEVWSYTKRYAEGMLYSGDQWSVLDRQSVLAAVENLKKQTTRTKLPFCDVYIMVPCSRSPEFVVHYDRLNQVPAEDSFLESFVAAAKSEFSGPLASELKRNFLAEIEIVTFSYFRNTAQSEVGRQRIKTYLTTHENTGLFIVIFTVPACSVSAHDLLEQMSREDLRLADPENPEQVITITHWLNTYGLKQTGTPRASVILSAEPDPAALRALLAAEADPVDEITGAEIIACASNDFSQYKYCKMYASETCEVEIPTPFGNTYEDRVFDAILTLFIMELILFQDASLTLVQSRVFDEVGKYASCAESELT